MVIVNTLIAALLINNVDRRSFNCIFWCDFETEEG